MLIPFIRHVSGVGKKKRKIFCCNNRSREATDARERSDRAGVGVGGGTPPSHGVTLFEFCMSNGAI